MQWLIRRHPANAELLPKGRLDKINTANLLKDMKIPAFTPSVIDGLSGQIIRQVRYACSNPSGSLKALLFAAAVGANQDPQHPFWSLDDSALQLPMLLQLADRRNKSSHGQSKYLDKPVQELTQQMVEESISYALSFTERFKEWM